MPTWSRYRAERISSALFGPLKGSARTLRSWRSRTERGAASTRPRTPWSEWTCTPSHDPNGERARPGAAGDPGQRARRLAPAAQRCRPLRRRARPAPPPRPPGPGDAPGRPCRPRRRHSRGAGRRARAGLRPGPARPGQIVPATLLWQATGYTPRDLQTGLRLVAQDGSRLLSERWGRPNRERTPTGKWLIGEIVPDTLLLRIPADAPPGRYRLLAGLRDPDANDRAPLGLAEIGELEIR